LYFFNLRLTADQASQLNSSGHCLVFLNPFQDMWAQIHP